MAYNAPPSNTKMYKNGYYILNESTKDKYIGDPSKIVFRSSLEEKFCRLMDLSKTVKRWGSETIGVPYLSSDGRQHTYWVDFYVELITTDASRGYLDKLLVEVKPDEEYQRIILNIPPAKPKKLTEKSLKSWEYALKEYDRNLHKWTYAIEYAKKNHMRFVVITDKNINKYFNTLI